MVHIYRPGVVPGDPITLSKAATHGLTQIADLPTDQQRAALDNLFGEHPAVEKAFKRYFEQQPEPSDMEKSAHYQELAAEADDCTLRAGYAALAARHGRART